MEREQRLLAIVRAQTEIAGAGLDQAGVIEAIAGHAREITGAEGAIVELLEAGRLASIHAIGSAASCPQLARLCLGSGRVVRCDDAERDARVDRDECLRAGTISIVCAPLVQGGRAGGVLQICSSWPRRFSAADEETLTLLAGVLAAHLERAGADSSAAPHVQDPLTRAGNRFAFDERLALDCGRREREGGALTLVLVDLDDFAQLNGGHGRQAGDGVLRTVAALLERWTRSIDGVFRIGADEFALILPGTTAEAAQVLVERVTRQLRDAHPLDVTASFGIAEATGHDPAGLLAAATSELDRARQRRLGTSII